ncbi:MAG TPA: amylo-alpha-1,6-glucosidase [Planctomycetota bacterium]|nr:amylo-alpha-1,6-glucosidase [Planctomycetota bacterium]
MNGQVLFVVDPSGAAGAAEREAARAWLAGSEFSARDVAPESLARALAGARVLWWHGASRPRPPGDAEALRAWIAGGGTALLTLQAAALVGDLGLDPAPPNRVGAFPWERPAWELRALQGERRGLFPYFSHPLFEGMTGGATVLEPKPGRAYPEAVYADGAWPETGRVVARESAYLDLDPTRIPAWELLHGRGAVFCIGAHLLFAEAENPFRVALERLARNALLHLLERRYARRSARHWPRPQARAAPFRFEEEERPLVRTEPPFADPTPALVRGRGTDAFFDVAGLEIRLLGRERSGIAEVWTGALRCLRNRRVRFLPSDGGEPVAEGEALVETRVRPFSVERVFRVGGARLVERIVPEPASPSAVFSWRVESGAVSGIELEAEFDHRLFWPMREGAAGSLRFAWSARANAFAVRDEEDRFAAALGFDREPLEPPRVEDRGGETPRLALRAVFGGPRFDGLRAVVAGSDGGHLDALEVLEATLSRGEKVSAAAAERAKRLFDAGLAIESGEGAFDEAFAWTAAKLVPFVADFPRIGRAIAAGFQTTREGWSSGRPGYDWFFGRDAFWSAPAFLALGRREAVLGALEAAIRLQDPSGKILHEATPSGAVHYDAADSTPLFLVAVERYLRWSGDLPFARRHGEAIARALSFAFSTDRDGDGLIENAGVGHGWVEGGPLYGNVHATFYLNACWAEALRCAGRIAEATGEGDLAARCARESDRVRALLVERFYDPRERRFAFAIRRDGTADLTPTIEPAVGALFGLLEPERLERFLEEVASPRSTTPWGVRFLPSDHAAYDPRGYHHGSVWPLFTGWVALAEFRHHRADAALAHLRSSLGLLRRDALGCLPEVLDGDSGEFAGVCPHQAWSHALTISGTVEGMLGVEPDAPADRLSLAPHLPREWNGLAVKRLSFGDHEVDLLLAREGAGLRVALEHRGPRPLEVLLSPAFGGGVEIGMASVGGRRTGVSVERNGRDQHAAVRLSVEERTEVRIEAAGPDP